jgi:drug/metabolite transporter (DMT)-like permease
MPTDFPGNDPRNVWQQQGTEPFKMSADELRRKARRWQTKARLRVVSSAIIALGLCIGFVSTFVRIDEELPRLGLGVMILSAIYFAYQSYKWLWPSRLPPDANARTSLEFYRSKLEKRRDYVRHVWMRAGLTFLFLGLALFIAAPLIKSIGNPRLLFNMAPFFVILAIWIVLFRSTRRRQQRKIQHEIDDLRALETDRRP